MDGSGLGALSALLRQDQLKASEGGVSIDLEARQRDLKWKMKIVLRYPGDLLLNLGNMLWQMRYPRERTLMA